MIKNLLTKQPTFKWPSSRICVFDEIAEKIVRELAARNFDVPGIEIGFDTTGTGEEKYIRVSEVKGKDFRLRYSRKQGSLNDRNSDLAALQNIDWPKNKLSVYDDGTGSYIMYVGTDWKIDCDDFMKKSHVLTKYHGEKRISIKYSQRGTMYVHENDHREYSPEGNEPTRIPAGVLHKRATHWLKNVLLKRITKHPLPEKHNPDAFFTAPDIIPYDSPWKTLFSLCNSRYIEQPLIGLINPERLEPHERYVAFSSHRRLCNLGVPNENGAFDKICYDGFMYFDTNQGIDIISTKDVLDESIINNMGGSFGTDHVIAISPKYANGIYVIDDYEFDRKRKELFEAMGDERSRLTDDEVNQAYIARAKTLVPINEYKGWYARPIVIINRELEISEVKWISPAAISANKMTKFLSGILSNIL